MVAWYSVPSNGSIWSFPGGSVIKNQPANANNAGLIPGLGRSPGGGNGNPLQYSCLGNLTDRGAWWATVHEVSKESDMTQQLQCCRPPPFSRPPPAPSFPVIIFLNDHLTSTISIMFYLNGSCQTGPNWFFSFVDCGYFSSFNTL